MKRIVTSLFFAAGIVLAGCPIYSGNGNRDCNNPFGDSYCGDVVPVDASYSGYCTSPSDCASDQVCGEDDYCHYGSCADYGCSHGYTCELANGSTSCVPANGTDAGQLTFCTQPSDCPVGTNCGSDDTCHPGDCSTSGCPSGNSCLRVDGGAPSCVTSPTSDGGAAATSDASDSSAATFSGCSADTDCADAGSGAKCLNGACTAAADQCFDTTQCDANEQCVEGVCTPSCSPTLACPTGYACNTSQGVCTTNPAVCGAGGSACSSGTTCVDQHCVTQCGTGGACTTGLVCVDNGCIPDQSPHFTCGSAQGDSEGQQDECATGSICLHHNCYIACDVDAANACQSADKFNVCKSVSTSSGSYSVCGSNENLGTDCDPTQNLSCTGGKVCIDGYCR